MSGITHGMKKRMSLLTTRKKTVENGLPDEYNTAKRAMEREKKTLERALALLDTSHDSWKQIGHSYKKFADLVSSDASVDAALYPQAGDAAKAANAVHHKLQAGPEDTASRSRMIAHVKAFLAEVSATEKDCVDVEGRWVESNRYETKVSRKQKKMEKAERKNKADKAEKVKKQLHGNESKYEAERVTYESKLTSTIDRMKRINSHFDKVLHCAHAAYWLEQHEVLTFISEKTSDARTVSVAHQDELVNLDLGAKPKEIKG